MSSCCVHVLVGKIDKVPLYRIFLLIKDIFLIFAFSLKKSYFYRDQEKREDEENKVCYFI